MAEEKKQLTPEQKKKRRTVFVVIIIVLVLIIGTVITVSVIRKRKNKKALEEAKKKEAAKLAGEQAAGSEAGNKPEGNDNFPLEEGSKGENVRYLQRAINRLLLPGKPKLKEDGIFGHETYLGLIVNVGTKYYPVTAENFNKILTQANETAGGK